MNIQELKQQFVQQLIPIWERIQESALYNKASDRYENLSPMGQRFLLLGGAAFLAFLILSFPYGFLITASESVAEFESKRNLIRELLKVTREASEVPDLPKAPPNDQLKDQINGRLKSAQIYQEQILSLENFQVKSTLFPTHLTQGGVLVHLVKLNLRQIVDVGYQLQNINLSVKLKDIEITPNNEDPKYMDVKYGLVSLAVPDVILPPMEPKGAKDSKGGDSPSKKEDESPAPDLDE